MVVHTADKLAIGIAEASILIVSCRIIDDRIIIRIVRLQVVKVRLAASTCDERYLVAELDFSTRILSIEDAVAVNRSELAELDLEVVVVALCPDALERDISILRFTVRVAIRILSEIRRSIKTSLYMPVGINLSRRLEAEQELVIIRLGMLILVAMAPVRITCLAIPFYHVGIALEVADADAEVVELIGELSSEFVDQGLVGSGDIALGHSLSDHLSHLITRDVLVATEGRVAVALDDAVSCELGYSIVSPMVSRYIGERVCCCKRRAGCANDESRRQSGYKSLLHEKLLLLYD